MSTVFQQSASSRLDYIIDWANWLDADTISASSWSVSPAGPTLSSTSNTTTTATVWVTGGTTGQNYTLTNSITTAGTRTDSRSITLAIRSQ